MVQKTTIILLLLLINCSVNGQNENSDTLSYTSRKGIYKINYNKQSWQKSSEKSKWDAEFHDSYDLISAYFAEYDYFISDKSLKSAIREQFKNLGKLKNLKTFKKEINELEVNYFECELKYNDLVYIFQGFTYNGKGGSVELQFGYQKECSVQCEKLINDFCSGIEIIK